MLLSSLPQPQREYAPPAAAAPAAALPARISKEPPPYGSAERRTYVPRKQEDFGDGGACADCKAKQQPAACPGAEPCFAIRSSHRV
jgi:hypothetical protein